MPRFSPSRPATPIAPKPGVRQLEDRSVPAALGGTIYADVNGNLTRDDGEAGLGGMTVHLDLNTDGIYDLTTATDAAGAYLFADVPSGPVTLFVEPSPEDTAVGPTTRRYAVTGADVTTANIGLRPRGEVRGVVFSDLNGNGTRDDGEAGLANIRVHFDAFANGSVNFTAGTAADGTFAFTGTPNGMHTVKVTAPASYTPSGANPLMFTVADGATPVLAIGLRPEAGTSVTVGSGTESQGQAWTFVPNDDGTLTPVPAQTIDPPGATGTRVYTADVNGDGADDQVTATGAGERAMLRVYDGTTGTEVAAIPVFEDAFTGGLNVTAADFNGDGKADLVAAADTGGGPRVQVLNAAAYIAGTDDKVLADFMGIDDETFRGGARVGTGDMNGDGTPDLLVAAGIGGGPRVALFDGTSIAAGAPERLVADFFVFESTLRDGTVITVGDVDGDGKGELVVGAGPGGAPRVVVFSGADVLAGKQADAVRIADFYVNNDTESRDGTRLVVRDVDSDGKADLIATAGNGLFAYSGARILEYYLNPTPGGLVASAAIPPITGGPLYVG